jgi:hypothetical protein
MAINLTELKQEFLNDPMSLGYSTNLSSRNDIGLCSLINEIRDGDDYLINRGRITKDEFIELTTSMVFNLMLEKKNGNPNAQFWLEVFDRLVANSDTINCNDQALASILDQMSADGLISSGGVRFIKLKQGSRAEILFGKIATIDEVSNSLNEVEI